MLEHRYPDDSANMVYGYVSPYGTTNPTGNIFLDNYYICENENSHLQLTEIFLFFRIFSSS